MANLMKQTEERHSESRMREIRPSGSMRGKDVSGHWPCAFHPGASFPTLLTKANILRKVRRKGCVFILARRISANSKRVNLTSKFVERVSLLLAVVREL
jgi:hypothetical protein